MPKSIPVSELTDEMYARGRKRARQNLFDVVEARYSRAHDALQLTLRKGIVVSVPRRHIRELAKARATGLAKVEIQPGGDGITFRSIDVDISVPGLLADELGSIFAKALGSKTKGRTSVTKAAASPRERSQGRTPPKSGRRIVGDDNIGFNSLRELRQRETLECGRKLPPFHRL